MRSLGGGWNTRIVGRERGEGWRATVGLEAGDRWNDDGWESMGAVRSGWINKALDDGRDDHQWMPMRTNSEGRWNEGKTARNVAGSSTMAVGGGRGYKRKTNMETEGGDPWLERARSGPSIELEDHDQRMEHENSSARNVGGWSKTTVVEQIANMQTEGHDRRAEREDSGMMDFLSDRSWMYSIPNSDITMKDFNLVFSMLLEKSVQPDMLNSHKQTPLMLAAMHGKISCVERLIQAGANILMFDSSHGRTCLHYAAYYGHLNCLQAILFTARSSLIANSWGFSRFVNVKDDKGATPLHLTAKQRQSACVYALLDIRALVHASTGTYGYPGSSALHLAARAGSLDSIQALLAWGADRLQIDSAEYASAHHFVDA